MTSISYFVFTTIRVNMKICLKIAFKTVSYQNSSKSTKYEKISKIKCYTRHQGSVK